MSEIAYDQDAECESCGHEGTKTHSFEGHEERIPSLEQRSRNLCKVCASTHAGNALRYPSQYEHRKVMQMLGWVANEILFTIEADRRKAGKQ